MVEPSLDFARLMIGKSSNSSSGGVNVVIYLLTSLFPEAKPHLAVSCAVRSVCRCARSRWVVESSKAHLRPIGQPETISLDRTRATPDVYLFLLGFRCRSADLHLERHQGLAHGTRFCDKRGYIGVGVLPKRLGFVDVREHDYVVDV